MKAPIICISIVLLSLTLFITGCKYDKGIPDYGGFPKDVGDIILTKCATTGCHTDASKGASGALSFETWDKLFQGGSNSAAVIPYRADQSSFFTFVNTFVDLGVTESPTMPFNGTSLSRDEVLTIKNWIDNGAPNSNGEVKFADNPNRKKIYVANQGCDMVVVFDQETLLPMRYINVGNSPSIESPHMVKVSPDKQYWYVVSLAGNSLQKYRATDDRFVGEAILGVRDWNTFSISHDGSKAYVVDWSASGDIAEVDLNSLSVTHNIGFDFPHGSTLNPPGDTLYVTQQTGSSKIYKIPVSDFSSFEEVNLYSTLPSHTLDAHEVLFSPDGAEYYVTCQGTTELRIVSRTGDQLLGIVPVGGLPSELVASSTHNYLFISCPEDTLSFPGKRGAVWVMDIPTHNIVKVIYTGHQPHGIAVDDEKNMVYVANRNATVGGPAPHHTSTCGGKNGYVTFIDMNTLDLVKDGNNIHKVEVSVDPYSVYIRE